MKQWYLDDLYTEERLYLDSLVNSYDTSRYELCTNENTSDKSDFALWSDKDGVASYDVNNENSVYKNGIGKQETETSILYTTYTFNSSVLFATLYAIICWIYFSSI